mmetsp:Transcript_11420/g.32416  ORF Transcript_11420/g.32416 Transcript_11420/m.32416 type:complete len:294 (+) Transcript_11420:347-1228(+)
MATSSCRGPLLQQPRQGMLQSTPAVFLCALDLQVPKLSCPYSTAFLLAGRLQEGYVDLPLHGEDAGIVSSALHHRDLGLLQRQVVVYKALAESLHYHRVLPQCLKSRDQVLWDSLAVLSPPPAEGGCLGLQSPGKAIYPGGHRCCHDQVGVGGRAAQAVLKHRLVIVVTRHHSHHGTLLQLRAVGAEHYALLALDVPVAVDGRGTQRCQRWAVLLHPPNPVACQSIQPLPFGAHLERHGSRPVRPDSMPKVHTVAQRLGEGPRHERRPHAMIGEQFPHPTLETERGIRRAKPH